MAIDDIHVLNKPMCTNTCMFFKRPRFTDYPLKAYCTFLGFADNDTSKYQEIAAGSPCLNPDYHPERAREKIKPIYRPGLISSGSGDNESGRRSQDKPLRIIPYIYKESLKIEPPPK